MKTVCPHCLELYAKGKMRREAIQPLRGSVFDSLANDRRPQCQDCATAGTLAKLSGAMNQAMARTAVANFRQESMRMPNVCMDLAIIYGARVSETGELHLHHRWLDTVVPDLDKDT